MPDYVIVTPAGTRHNVTNVSPSEPLRLHTAYSPPEHEAATVHRTEEEADDKAVHRSEQSGGRVQTLA
jgi:mannose-6-phosphate isomerase-like protein (cupin superfamily)